MGENVSRLKALLLDEEQRKLDDLYERAGTSERLQKSVAEVLDGAFREAEVDRHSELSAAVSPVIIETVKQEVRNSSDELADALYPHMGRMVSAYVANAIKDMMDKMNRRLESGLSPRRWMIKLKSIVTGRSEAELLLAELNQLRVEEIFLIRRGSGELVQHWQSVGAGEVAGAPAPAPGSQRDPAARANQDAVVSAFLAAINDFSREAFAANEGSLQTLDVQSHRIYLRSSPAFLLAAKCSGVPSAETERLLDQEFAATIEKHRGLLSAKLNGQHPAELGEVVPGLAQRLQTKLDASADSAKPKGPNLAKGLLYTIAALLIGWLLWEKLIAWQTERTYNAVAAVLEGSNMRSYPVSIQVKRGGAAVHLKGLAPSQSDKDVVLAAVKLAVGSGQVTEEIALLPQGSDLTLQSVQREMAEGLERNSAAAALQATRRALERTRLRLRQVSGDVARLPRDAADGRSAAALAAVPGHLVTVTTATDEVWQTAMRASASDDLTPLESRLTVILTTLRGATTTMAEVRGEKPPLAPERPAVSRERHARVREEAELIAISSDTLWNEVAATERYLLQRTITGLKARTARQELEDWARANAVFFGNDTSYRDDAEVRRTLDALVALMARSDALVRIVGYTDEVGTAQRNSTLALDRANRVRQDLIQRGVAANRVVVLGRPTGPTLSPVTGAGSPNRRVEFEVGFVREAGGG